MNKREKILAIITGSIICMIVVYMLANALLLGPETRGLPQSILDALPAEQRLRLPMQSDSRSLNLANTAAVVIYEAWRQNDFAGGS